VIAIIAKLIGLGTPPGHKVRGGNDAAVVIAEGHLSPSVKRWTQSVRRPPALF